MELTKQGETEVKVISDQAETVYISTQKYSYGIFCYNSKGDLFLSSDWGMYGFAWRSYGESFPKFLSQVNPDYVFDKFDFNSRYLHKKGLPKHVEKPVKALIAEFVKYMQTKSNGTN